MGNYFPSEIWSVFRLYSLQNHIQWYLGSHTQLSPHSWSQNKLEKNEMKSESIKNNIESNHREKILKTAPYYLVQVGLELSYVGQTVSNPQQPFCLSVLSAEVVGVCHPAQFNH